WPRNQTSENYRTLIGILIALSTVRWPTLAPTPPGGSISWCLGKEHFNYVSTKNRRGFVACDEAMMAPSFAMPRQDQGAKGDLKDAQQFTNDAARTRGERRRRLLKKRGTL